MSNHCLNSYTSAIESPTKMILRKLVVISGCPLFPHSSNSIGSAMDIDIIGTYGGSALEPVSLSKFPSPFQYLHLTSGIRFLIVAN
jgi:hypothetical protein